ncbi:MAG TPA: MFS transporter [Solirubrobacteraceae bacterium]|nr:MFS transporter [Solirubrobacteraceae bacterium]
MHSRWLNRGVAGIGVASFFSDVSHEVPTALLPALLTTTLGAPAAALGTIEGIADGIAGAAKLAGGALADDPGRRRATAMGGYTATAVLSALIGAATAAWQVGVLRAGAWLSRGLRTPSRNALLTDVVVPEAYGRAYGFERAMDNAGAIAGPLLALALISLVGIREAILLSVIPGLLAALAIFVAVRSARRLEPHERPPLRIRIRPVLHGRLGRLFAAVTAFELGNVAATLLILRATNLLTPGHGHDSAVRLAVVLYAVYNAAAMVISIPAGHVTDRRGATAVLAVGAVGALAAFTGFALAGTSVALLAALFALAGTGKGAVETAQGAAVAVLAPPDLLGSAFGALATIQSFANLAASAVAGALWTLVSPRTAFLYLAGWTAVSVVTLVAVRR